MVAYRSLKQPLPALIDLELEADSGIPIFRQIARQLRSRIQNQVLSAGTRLPPSRELARQLGVARNSVIDAYDELTADGLLDAQGRHGTFVAGINNGIGKTGQARPAMPLLSQRLNQPALLPGNTAGWLDWRPGQANTQTLPLEVWRNACRAAGRHLPPQGYGDARGDVGLRRAIVEMLREHRSVHVDAQQIIVTHGTGHALQLLAQALLKPGDICACEDPGFVGANLAFQRSGAALEAIPVDAEGILLEPLAQLQQAPLLLHLTPTHQYPLGGRLAGPRRRELVQLARQRGMLIIENEYDCEFHYAGTNYPPIFNQAPESTILLNTFGKAISPALKLGFMVAPQELADTLSNFIERERVHISWPVQKILETLLISGELDRHLRRVRRHYSAMREQIRGRLTAWPGRIGVSGDEGGLHVVIRADQAEQDQRLRAALRAHGVLLNQVADFSLLAPDQSGFLFSYGHLDEAALQRALDLLQRCIEAVI